MFDLKMIIYSFNTCRSDYWAMKDEKVYNDKLINYYEILSNRYFRIATRHDS